jgi:hypothetical protein
MPSVHKKCVKPVPLGAHPSFNGRMHARAWARCLARDTGSNGWCQRRPSDGVFCMQHAWEFRCDEADKAATRVARARLVLCNPSAPPWRRRWAALEMRRARSLRRSLLAKVDLSEARETGIALVVHGPTSSGDLTQPR